MPLAPLLASAYNCEVVISLAIEVATGAVFGFGYAFWAMSSTANSCYTTACSLKPPNLLLSLCRVLMLLAR